MAQWVQLYVRHGYVPLHRWSTLSRRILQRRPFGLLRRILGCSATDINLISIAPSPGATVGAPSFQAYSAASSSLIDCLQALLKDTS